MSEGLRLLNRWPHTQIGFCFQCGQMYSLTQVRFPASGDGVSLTGMEHPPGLIDKMADAIRDGRLSLKR